MNRPALRQKIEDTLKTGSFGGPDYFIDVFGRWRRVRPYPYHQPAV